MGFKEKQAQIAKKQGVSQEAAGRILGAAAKKSVAKSRAAHQKPKSNMKRVVSAQKPKGK